ncbi:MAG TPA: AI-2E family transporter [Gammaproteobacteria bacterium]|jgi:predicted PurR-regulated permease PerM|nr:AI-2E family transporter [Gammaproteobacteria bacterium]
MGNDAMTIVQKIWIVFGAALAIALIYMLRPILTPFIVSAILAYLGDPLVDRLQRLRLSRSIAVLVVFKITILVLLLLLLLVLPMVTRELAALFAHMPDVLIWFQQQALPWLSAHLGMDVNVLAPGKLAALLSDNFVSAGKIAGNALLSISRSGGAVFAFFLNLILIPVVTFYLLRDWDDLVARIAALLPRNKLETVTRLARDCDIMLGAFLRGQLSVMVGLAIIYTLGLWLVGLENAVAIGVIAGLLSFVPYLGVITGITLALLSALLQAKGWWLPLEVLVVFSVGQLMESFVLTPRLVGKRIGLHPVLVIFAILVGGQLFGFAGVLLALPVAAAGTVLVRHAHAQYLGSKLYQGAGNDQP